MRWFLASRRRVVLVMLGVLVGLDQPWTLADGTEVDGPGEPHPNCRCLMVIRPAGGTRMAVG